MTTISGTNGFMDTYYMSTGKFDAMAEGYVKGVTCWCYSRARRLSVLCAGELSTDHHPPPL
jgi:hypothetical protein